MIFIGIDPGKHGALAWMDGERTAICVRDCPLVRDEYDFQGMADMLFQLASPETVITMEAVHSMPSDGKCSAFSFGLGYGAWLALIGGVARTTPNLVSPRTWKRAMLAGVANDKGMEAESLTQRLQGKFNPGELYGPRGGLRDGRVDALWLAEYGRVQYRFKGIAA